MLRSSPVRMMGLSSGMDTESIIQQTLRIHQMKIDSRMRARTILEWRQATQTSIRDQIRDFRNMFLNSQSSSGLLTPSAFNSTVAEVTGKNSGAVTVRAMTGASAGTVRIDQIVSMAKGANMTSASRASTTGQGFSMGARIDSLALANGSIAFGGYQATSGEYTVSREKVLELGEVDWGNATTTMTVGEHTVTFEKVGGNIEYTIKDNEGNPVGPVGTLEFDLDGKATITVDGNEIELTKDGDQITMAGQLLRFRQTANVEAKDGDGLAATIQIQRLEGATDPLAVEHNGSRLNFVGDASITIDGVGITLKSDMTISSMITSVNSQLADAGKDIKMNYDGRADRFSLESPTVGGAAFTASGQALTAFGFVGTSSQPGSRAEMIVTVNGIKETIYSNTNTFTMGDSTITINNTTAVGDEPINVAFKRDATEAVAKIKNFIDAYNSIIQRIESLVRERKAPNEVSYGPLTEEEKAKMSDRQIEQWEAIARKGILRNDPGLQTLATRLRRELFVAIDSVGLTPQAVGITTGRFDSGLGGQIVLDENKLKAMLEEDPDKVAQIFAGTDGNSGLLWRMNEHMSDFVSKTQIKTLRNLEDSIKRTNEQMTKMQERMYAEEDRLYRQFAAMETALSKMQQQGDWFSSMLSGFQK